MKNFMRILSMVLIICMLCNMLPMQIFATGNTATAEQQALMAVNPESKSITTQIIGEVTEKRTEYSKEFLLSDGSMVAAVYADPIHYEEDGTWQEIDNTLKVNKEGTYINTAGDWSVVLPQSISKTAPVIVSRDGYTLSFTMSGELRNQGKLEVAAVQAIGETTTMTVDGKAQTFRVESAQTVAGQVQKIDTSAAKAAAQHPEVVLDKNASQLQYSGVYANTQLRYDLHGTTLKESVILESYNSTLRGYRYTLQTGELLPVVNEDGSIYFMGAGKEPVFVMNAPYLIDDAEQCNYDVKVSLTGENGTYTLTYLLPTAWLASADRAWPVVLDPAITTKPDVLNTRDHTVAESGSYHYERPVLECGYGNVNKRQRIFLKYRVLPALKSSDVILDAQVALYKIENSSSPITVDVHKVENTWESETLTWANKPNYDTTIEDYALINLKGYYTWNVTDIVRGWYSGENTGMMFKASDQFETGTTATWKQFASSDNGTSAWMPSLQITFRNNNGIESYWDYTASSAGRAGTGYVNSFTGNLAWIRSDMGFSGNRMPVSISHIYNLNDSSSNEFGMGYGWRTNFNQRVYNWTQDTSYYVWEDSDGTSHYFKRQSDGTYQDEDGLELTLTVSNGNKTITDKNGNKSYFNSSGRLTKQENNQATKSSVNIAYTSDGKIDYVTDGVGRKYDFTYTDGLLSELTYVGSGSAPLATTVFTYSSGNLNYITDTDGKYCNYTYYGRALRHITDIDGYRVSYSYNTRNGSHQPYRVQSVGESDNGTNGGSLSIQYDHNQTTFTDALGNKQILQFNNYGNVTCIQDDEGHAQYAQYATESDTLYAKGNQLVKASRLQNTVGSRLQDGGMEAGDTWWSLSSEVTVSRCSEAAYMGSYGIKMTCTSSGTRTGVWRGTIYVAAGASYTFSAYVKTGAAAAWLSVSDGPRIIDSSVLPANNNWTRLEVSYTNLTNETVGIAVRLLTKEPGTTYMDSAQVELAPTASRFNIITNGDFRNPSSPPLGWSNGNGLTNTDIAISAATAAAPQLDYNVFKIVGSPTAMKRLAQTVPVGGSKDDSFVLAGWAKGNSAHIYEEPPAGQNKREYAIYGTFNYTDGTTSKAFAARFNHNTDQWQYSAEVMVAEKAYSSIKVELVYDYNVNYVYFDGIQLYKEEFGSSYSYDKDGNIVSVVDLQKQKTTYEYTNNNLTKEILPTGAELTYIYDSYHNVTKATTEMGQVYEFTYDTYGNNTSVSIVNGSSKITSSATYSTDGNRLLKTTDALGKVTTYDYDSNTNVLNWVKYPGDTDATKTTYTYDNMYRMAAAAANTNSNLSLSASYTYTDDLLTKIQTPSTTYNFTYGNFALRTNVSVGSQKLAKYTYAEVTNYLTALEYGNGDKVQYTYDDKGRLLTQSYEDGDTVTYTYDNNGALATVTDSATGIKTTYYYDFTDRMMKYVESGTNYAHSVGYEYDNINNLTSQVETINGVERTTSYTYDADNRVKTAQTGNTKVTYTYDGFGRVSQQVTTNGTTTVLTETFTYNAGSSQIRTYATTAGGATTTYTYTYDDNGNITSINDGTYTTDYEYDSANQLIRENNQEKGYTHTWTYSNAGNILERKEYAYTDGALGTLTDTVSYAYNNSDWGDLLTAYDSQTFSYDQIGNITDDGTWTYTWQHGRQLAGMAKKDGSATWSFAYNADGLRTSRTNGTTTYNYVYNGSQLTAMTVGSNTLYFSYDASGVPMSLTFNGTEYFYTTNIQGDVTGIVNSSGTTVVTYSYDAWGNILSITGSMAATLGTINPLRYRGYVYDQETSLYYLQFRYYDPEIGRFLNADNYISTGQGFLGRNMFAYCLNNPICYHDDGGTMADNYGVDVGVDFGVFLYELLTGREHPHRETKQLEQKITQEQTQHVFQIIIDFVRSDDYTKVKSGARMVSGAKDIGKGATALLVPDPTPVNEVAIVYKVAFGVVKVAWGFAEFLGEIIKK